MSARPFFHMVNIAKYRMVSNIQIHASTFVGLVGQNMTRKARLMLKNNSYVCIPADKLVGIIERCCPPTTSVWDCPCLDRKDSADEDCINCWYAWLKDGE